MLDFVQNNCHSIKDIISVQPYLYTLPKRTIMTKRMNSLGRLKYLYDQKKCCTINELCQKLNYSSRSIHRFLTELGYFSSFTHNSKWYTLATIPSFNKDGLWFYEDIGFSRHGNLKKTIVHLINRSSRGVSAKQLTEKLSIPCHAVLNHLYKNGLVSRSKYSQNFIYFSADEKKKRQQLKRWQLSQRGESNARKSSTLSAQAAVYVLIEFIKHPHASFDELSAMVAKRKIIATPGEIARFFEKHDLKKKPN